MRLTSVALTLLWSGGLAAEESLQHIGTTEWPLDAALGISGLEVSDVGMSFAAVSDQGWLFEGHFVRDGDQISSVELDSLRAIIGMDGLPVAARRVGDWSDAEGLAIAPDGTSWISFERWAHVWRYDTLGGGATFIKDHPNFYDQGANRQLEAIAVDPEGFVFTFPERPFSDGFPIYKLEDDRWVIDGYLPERDSFSIVGADFDEDGALYLLERKLLMGIWWQSRIRRVRFGVEDVTIWTSDLGQFNNLEGIAVWRDDDGLRITTVADNNASRSEVTAFVEFRLTD